MYVEQIVLKNVRTFKDIKLEFVHPDRMFRTTDNGDPGRTSSVPKPRFPNVNLLLGDNGSGKTTVLRAIAMAALGPSFVDTKLPTLGLVRRESGDQNGGNGASIGADLLIHDQDGAPGEQLRAEFGVERIGELERATYLDSDPAVWQPVFESKNDAFFAVGYGATRRVESPESLDLATRSKSTFLRAQRVQGLFQESFSLIPLRTWLPGLRGERTDHPKEVEYLLNQLLKPSHCTFTGMWKREGDYLFEHGGVKIPFQDLSDGYRAFVGWVADLLFHACYACPRGKKLVDLRGIVMVDEIDLHLHPRWQMKVISTIARALPRMQFILTSHSPLVAGSLEWMNIITLRLSAKTNRTIAKRLKESIHGLDADQVLLTDFFGLKTTRAPGKVSQLRDLERQARHGDRKAAREMILAMSRGMEQPE